MLWEIAAIPVTTTAAVAQTTVGSAEITFGLLLLQSSLYGFFGTTTTTIIAAAD